MKKPTYGAARWWEALAEASLDAQFIAEPIGSPIADFRILFANDAGAELFAMTPPQLVDQLLSSVAPPYGSGFRKDLVDSHTKQETVRRVTRTIAPQIAASQADYRIVPFDGLLAVSVSDRSVELAAETQSAMLGRLLAAEIATSLTASAVLIPIFDLVGTVVDVRFEQANEAVGELFGTAIANVVGRTMYEIIPKRNGGIVHLLDECVRSRQALLREYDARQSPVAADWLQIQLTPVADYVVLHARDVSKQRREEATLRALVEQSAELIAFSDREGSLAYVNPFARKTLGLNEASLAGLTICGLAEADTQAQVMEDFRAMHARTLDVARRRLRIRGAAGDLRTLIGSTVALRTATGSVDGFVTVMADLTEQIESEDARNQLAAELSMAEQRERERLAEDLHDGPVQSLSALSMQLGAAIDKYTDVDSADPFLAFLRRSEDIVVESIAGLRSLMFQLSPPDLEGVGLGSALRSRTERIFEGTEVRVVTNFSVAESLPTAHAVTLFRLGQEAVVNAHKHARASTITLTLWIDSDPSMVVLEISDDGVGADQLTYHRHYAGHLGIGMMIDRARQLGGSCVVTGGLGAGTTVRLALPLS